MEKICDRCKKSKPKEIFKRYKNCPECLLVINKENYKNSNKRIRDTIYREKNKQKMKEYAKLYKEKNLNKVLEKIKECSKNYYYNNKENLVKKQAEKRKTQAYIDYYRKYQKEYNLKNKDKINKRNTERRKNDINYKLKVSLRSRIRSAVKVKNAKKISNTVDLIGTSIQKLKTHLESKFLPTMTWENYGKYWHIDHIIPCDKFNLTVEEEQRKCFHYTNLQPLFAVTQIIDGITYIGNLNKNNKI